MKKRYKESFFGEKTAMIFDSGRIERTPFVISHNFFLTFINKKGDGSWQKPSEGRMVEFNLVETAYILLCLQGKFLHWNTIHSFEGQKMSISFDWRDFGSTDNERIVIKAGDYSKDLCFEEIKVFAHILDHVLREKIKNITPPTECPTLFSWDYKEEAPIMGMQKRAEKCCGKIFRVDTHGDENMAIVGGETIEDAVNFYARYLYEFDLNYIGVFLLNTDIKYYNKAKPKIDHIRSQIEDDIFFFEDW